MAAFAHIESSLSESWPLGALQLVFVPPAVCPPSGLHTAAGLAILSADHLVPPQALEQVSHSMLRLLVFRLAQAA